MVHDSRLRTAVIGAGGIATNSHLPSLSEIPAYDIVAICDIVEGKARRAAENYDIPKTYTLYKEMLEREALDCVFVLVQPDQLFRITLDCLEAELDVFMEKPPGVTTFQAESLQRKAAEKGKILQVGLNRRYIPLVTEVLQIVRDVTPITQVEGRFFKHSTAVFYGGAESSYVCDTIHAIDLVRWIAGSKPLACATVRMQVDEVTDNAWNSVIRFESGITGIVKANYRTGGRIHTFEVHGPGASAFINLGFGEMACQAEILFHQGRSSHSISAAGNTSGKRLVLDGLDLAGSKKAHRFYGFYQEDEQFAECVLARRQPLASISEAVETMSLVDMLRSTII